MRGQSKRREGLLSTRSKVGVRIMSATAAADDATAAPRRRFRGVALGLHLVATTKGRGSWSTLTQ